MFQYKTGSSHNYGRHLPIRIDRLFSFFLNRTKAALAEVVCRRQGEIHEPGEVVFPMLFHPV